MEERVGDARGVRALSRETGSTRISRREVELGRVTTYAGALQFLLAAFAGLALARSPEAVEPASSAPSGARVEASLLRAIQGPLPAGGIAIGVTLREVDLPTPGAERRFRLRARQDRVLDALPPASFQLKRRYESLSGFSGWAQPAAIEALARHPEVLTVYVDGAVQATLAQGVALIGADTAHAQGFTGAGINVAVLDSGIDTDHSDLQDDLMAEQCFCQDNHPSPMVGGPCCRGGVETASGPGSAEDDESHGTKVSGIVTSGGVVAPPGVAPDAGIAAVKVLDRNGNGTFSDVASGLDWVLTHRNSFADPIRVVNMSLGDGGEYDSVSVSPCSGTNTANAIAALHAAGVAVFVSSGNQGHDDGIAFPACVADAISVGGVYDANVGPISWCGNIVCTNALCTDNPTAADVFVCHSNSDELLDLLAPNFRTRTSNLGGGVELNFGGTSASSPYAAAQAALLFQADGGLTPDQIRALLASNGPLVTNPDNELSFPRSDVGGALATLGEPAGVATISWTARLLLLGFLAAAGSGWIARAARRGRAKARPRAIT